ncbi:tyrosine-protein phosphatase Lar-like isoform X4 [Dreissena polymorpha]|uniref:tyrosine-protein phosphatase Lar-like isoform X4 n=1 Tax=Dreissena polymorpha TaxID=45954 RepID=UPI002264D771|nr:tyrosine-protein phosphatase Lar-like isoform X4 [Dreissena polymorpha]
MHRKLSLNLLIVSTFVHVAFVNTATTPTLQTNTTATLSLEAMPASSSTIPDSTPPALSAITSDQTLPASSATTESNTSASLETISESTSASLTSISELTSASLESTSQSASLENTSQSTSVSLASTSDMTSASLATTSDLKSESLAPTSVSTSASFENTSVLTSVSLATTSESTSLVQSSAASESTSASLPTTSELTSALLATTSASPSASLATTSESPSASSATTESNTSASLETISESTSASLTSISESTSASLESTSQSASLENTSQSTSVSLASTSDMTSASLATTSDLKSESLAPTSVSTSASFENTSVLTSVSLATTSESTTLVQSSATSESTSASLPTTSELTSASLATTLESPSASLATTSESPSASLAITSESTLAQSATTSELTSTSLASEFESTSAQSEATPESTSVSLTITADSQTSASLANTSGSTSVSLVTTSESTSAYSATTSTITDSLTIISELTTTATSPATHASSTTTHETQATTTPSDSMPPNCTTGFDIQNVTHNQVIFSVTNITDDHTFEFYVINTHSNGTTNSTNGNCDLTIQYCYVSKNTTVAVNGLLSGTLYTFSFRTAKKEIDDTFLVSSGICENVSFHTVPSTPTNVSVPMGFIFETNFTVNVHMLDDRFSHLEIFACTESCIIIISNKTGDYENISLVVDKLRGATNYSIRVTAVLDNFTKSKESEPIYSITAPLPPNATLEASQNSSIELMLTTDADASFDGYLIRYNNATERHVMRENRTSALIENLHPGTRYTFRVFTVLSSITSERYATVNTFTRPSPVLTETVNITLITNSSIHLVWDSVIPEDAGGYDVSCNCSSPNTNKLTTPTSSSSLPSASCTGLDPGTFCTIYIQTYIMNYEHGNLTGENMFIHLQNSTSEEAPGIVSYANVSDFNSTSVTLSWQIPELRNGIIRQYVSVIKTEDTPFVFATLWQCIDCSGSQTILQDVLISKTVEFNKSRTSFSDNVTGLHPFRNYTYTILAYTVKEGPGVIHIFQTMEDIPGKPVNVSSVDIGKNSIVLTWKPPIERNGIVLKYTITYMFKERVCRGLGGYTSKYLPVNSTSYTMMDSIYPHWNYSIWINASNSVGTGNVSDTVDISTIEERPSSDIDSISSAMVTSNNATINWSDPCYMNGILTAYFVELNNTAGESQGFEEWKIDQRNIVLDGLLPFRNYSVRVKAANSAGNGTYNASHRFQTDIDVPDSPSDVTTGNVTCCSIEVRWKRALNFTGPTQYTVVATDYHNTSIEFINTTHVGWWTDELADTSVVLGLDQFWSYSIKVIAETAYGNLNYRHNSTPVIIKTAEDRPGKVQNLNVTAEKDLQKPRKLYVSWDPPIERDRNGIIVHYKIYCTNGNQTVRAETSVGLGEHEESTVEVDPGSKGMISAPNLMPAIVGGVAAAVVVIVIVAVFVYTKRTKRVCFSANSKTVESARIVNEIEISELATEYVFKTGTISLAAFPDQVDKMHKDSNLLFADAFKMLKDKSPAYPSTAAETQQCRPKNRYTNIMPFDHSRVKLLAVDDVEGSDFINANFIPGYTSPREYIATQGPMQMTFDDFWRMVWEQSVDTIVMLTKLAEKGRNKCDQYWPTLNEPVFYGDIVVSIKSESNLPDYTLRIFEIKPSKGPSRIVKHFLYLKWPDMGCPDDPQMLLDFVKSVRDHTQRPDRTNPTVVHCSAGVGRTGTFIAVDHLLQHIRDHEDVDIFQLVLDMRKHRCNMVQTEDQFIYIYECLKTFITNDEDQAEPLYQNSEFGADNIYENAGFQTDL